MGAGKTTIGNRLATKMKIPYLDIDNEIAYTEKMSITDLFKMYGEQKFRQLEQKKLLELIETNAVIATGGGIVLDPINRVKLIEHPAPVIYLETSPEIFLARLRNDISRPLIKGKTDTEIKSVFTPRKAHYEACADFIVKTDDKTQEEIVKEILTLLKIWD